MTTKNDLHEFLDFLKIPLAVMIAILDLELRAIIDFFRNFYYKFFD